MHRAIAHLVLSAQRSALIFRAALVGASPHLSPRMMAFRGAGRMGFNNVVETRDADGKRVIEAENNVQPLVKPSPPPAAAAPAPSAQPHNVPCSLCKATIGLGVRYRCVTCANVGARELIDLLLSDSLSPPSRHLRGVSQRRGSAPFPQGWQASPLPHPR